MLINDFKLGVNLIGINSTKSFWTILGPLNQIIPLSWFAGFQILHCFAGLINLNDDAFFLIGFNRWLVTVWGMILSIKKYWVSSRATLLWPGPSCRENRLPNQRMTIAETTKVTNLPTGFWYHLVVFLHLYFEPHHPQAKAALPHNTGKSLSKPGLSSRTLHIFLVVSCAILTAPPIWTVFSIPTNYSKKTLVRNSYSNDLSWTG